MEGVKEGLSLENRVCRACLRKHLVKAEKMGYMKSYNDTLALEDIWNPRLVVLPLLLEPPYPGQLRRLLRYHVRYAQRPLLVSVLDVMQGDKWWVMCYRNMQICPYTGFSSDNHPWCMSSTWAHCQGSK